MLNVLKEYGDIVEEFLMVKNYPESILVEPIASGKWSIKDIIGHLLYWDKFNLEVMIPAMANGVVLPAFPNHDHHNQESIMHLEKYDNVSMIIDEFAKIRKQAITEIEVLDKDMSFQIEDESRQFSPETFVKIFLDHDFHHLNQIKEKLINVSIEG